MNLGFISMCQFMPVYAGINWHKLVFATDWQKIGLCRHFANLGGATPPEVFRG